MIACKAGVGHNNCDMASTSLAFSSWLVHQLLSFVPLTT